MSNYHLKPLTQPRPAWRREGAIIVALLALTACATKSPSVSPATPTPAAPTTTAAAKPAIPAAYTTHCSKCHGAGAEGLDKGKGEKGPALKGLTTRTEEPRTVADIIGIINNPAEYGLDNDMPGFGDKLNANEKKEIAEWLAAMR
jgi:mono/diheme cytochrome c family protein